MFYWWIYFVSAFTCLLLWILWEVLSCMHHREPPGYEPNVTQPDEVSFLLILELIGASGIAVTSRFSPLIILVQLDIFVQYYFSPDFWASEFIPVDILSWQWIHRMTLSSPMETCVPMQNSRKLFLKVKRNNKVNTEGQEDLESEFIYCFLKQGIRFSCCVCFWRLRCLCGMQRLAISGWFSHRISLPWRSISMRIKLDLRLSSFGRGFPFSMHLCGLLLWLWPVKEAKYFLMLSHPETASVPPPSLP